MSLKILQIAKEIGISYELLLAWCKGAGFPYRSPDEEVPDEEAKRIREILASRLDAAGGESLEDAFGSMMENEDLSTEGFPRTLEELEALEKQWIKSPATRRRRAPAGGAAPSPAEGRVPLQALLSARGISGKSMIRKVRRLLPEHLTRLLNHAELSKEEASALEEALESKVPFCCGDPACRALWNKRGIEEKDLVVVGDPALCGVCKGSSALRMLQELGGACKEAGVRRILILGGSPATHSEMRAGVPEGVELRLVEGANPREKHRPSADIQWCDLVVIWAGTILSHSLTSQYVRGNKAAGKPVITVRRRSVEALCLDIVEFLRKRREGGPS